MKEKLSIPGISSFEENARLNEDLYMDSIMVLQLILHVELDLGIKIPDQMLAPKDFHTVKTLLDFIEEIPNREV
jgi:acyl carrier protein